MCPPSGTFPTVPPIVTQGPGDMRVVEGANVILLCNVTADPPALIEWHFSGEALSSGIAPPFFGYSSLSLENLALEDAGTYSCVTTNIHGMATATAVLLVQGKVLNKL